MFGLVTMLEGFTQNYSGILAARFFLGMPPYSEKHPGMLIIE